MKGLAKEPQVSSECAHPDNKLYKQPFNMSGYAAPKLETVRAIAPLNEKSVANSSTIVDVPDFTTGFWKQNKPVDISFETGGNTIEKV